mmetsp:Transcript_13737/g.30522  ORF Transcript_13737/g.30522 Transcript_13737/m.30522 type:complete len:89 (-) Transcript_13737:99-365(-)
MPLFDLRLTVFLQRVCTKQEAMQKARSSFVQVYPASATCYMYVSWLSFLPTSSRYPSPLFSPSLESTRRPTSRPRETQHGPSSDTGTT